MIFLAELYDPVILSNLLDSDFYESFAKIEDAIDMMQDRNNYHYVHAIELETHSGICLFIIDKKKELSLPWEHLERRIDRLDLDEIRKKIDQQAKRAL